ncbi:MAG: hypothetical protein VW904_03000 [bacterium]
MKFRNIECFIDDNPINDKWGYLSEFITKTEFEGSSFTLEEIANLWEEMYGENIFTDYSGFSMSLVNKIISKRKEQNNG